MQGDLSSINLAELLLELHLSSRTGILRLTQGEIKKGIYFKDGSIVFAHSNLNTERLGETLLRLGKITEEEFRIASVEVIEKGKRLGRALYEKGFLSLSEINAGVSYQLQQIVYSVFNWDSGSYEFIDRERPVYEDIMVDVSTPNLLNEGIRHINNPIVLERVVGNDESRVVEPSSSPATLARSNLDFGEETILRCLGEKATIARLRSLSRLRPIEFGTAIYALLLSGMIHIRAAGSEEADRPEDRKTSEAYSYATRPMTPDSNNADERSPRNPLRTYSEPEMRRFIIETEGKYREMTDEEVLGVLPDCTRDEIERAFDKRISVFHPPLYSEDRYKDLKDKLKFISERLTTAHERLLEKAASRLPFTGDVYVNAAQAAVNDPGSFVQDPSAEIKVLQSKEEPPAPPLEELPEAPPAEASLADLEHQLKKDPINTALLRLSSKKLREAGKATDAEKRLLRALELEPQNVENHFALADFYQYQGLKIKAFRHLNIVLQLQPDNERAMELLSVKKRKKPLYEISRDQPN